MNWDDSYYTNSDNNITTIWHFLKKCHEKNWIGLSYRTMPWCTHCGTSLSEHEMSDADAYKDVTHLAIFFKCPIKNSNNDILVWTTTPWTLSANVAVAVHPELEYSVAKVKSSATIMGEVWYKVEVELPKVYHEEIRTNKTFKSLTFKIINNHIPRTKNNKSYDIEDKVIFKNKLFPIGLYLETKHELKIIDKKYNLGNCEKEAIKIATSKLEKKLTSNSSILSKNVLKKTLKNSTILVEIFFKVKEDITDYKEISSELKEGDDSEGNN
jgi:hypothetical protein